MSWLPLERGTGEAGWDVWSKQDFLLKQVWTSELEMGTETTISCGRGEPALCPPWDWGFLPPEISLDVGGSQESQSQAGWRGGPIGRAAGPGVPRTGRRVSPLFLCTSCFPNSQSQEEEAAAVLESRCCLKCRTLKRQTSFITQLTTGREQETGLV